MVAFILYTWASLTWSYSVGDRAGYIQKFSEKGWICKTWEGELAMVTMPGQIPEKFFFTVRDGAVENEIEKHIGQRVVLKYNQHMGIPTSCFGETQYFITSVEKIEE